MKFNFIHIPIIWFKSILSKAIPSNISEGKISTAIKLIFCLTATVIVSVFYAKSYRVPVRKINFDITDTVCDSIDIEKLEYLHDFVSNNSSYKMMNVHARSHLKSNQIKQHIVVNNGHYSPSTEVSDIYGDYFNLIEKYPVDYNIDSLCATEGIFCIKVTGTLPSFIFPIKSYEKNDEIVSSCLGITRVVKDSIFEAQGITCHHQFFSKHIYKLNIKKMVAS